MGALSERFAVVHDFVAGYGYEVRDQAGGEDGNDWEITFFMPAGLESSGARHTVTVVAPTEAELLRYLARYLPNRAALDWRRRAGTLESALARAQR